MVVHGRELTPQKCAHERAVPFKPCPSNRALETQECYGIFSQSVKPKVKMDGLCSAKSAAKPEFSGTC
jgi:hypothetical protein